MYDPLPSSPPCRPWRTPRLVLPAALALLLGACAANPPEAPPKIAMPQAYSEPHGRWQTAGNWAAMPRGAWWKVFGDPVLDRLEPQVAQHNQTLAAQLAAYEQAQAAVSQARAAYYPTLSATLAGTRAKSSSAGTNSLYPGRTYDTASATAAASWVPDLWGRVRLQVLAGESAAEASAGTLLSTRLSLQATLAQSYLQLRTVDAQTRLAESTVAAYRHALHLTENRYHAGVDTAADVAQARTQLLQAQTSLTDLGVTRIQLQNAIAVLIGKPPADFSLPALNDLPPVPRIPPGIPASLLLRRPDLAAAQATVEAANAQIGVARTAWFPNLTLSAQGGSQVTAVSQLFSAPSLFWSLGPSLAANLFEGGLRHAQIASARAAYRQTVADYRQAVLTALQQVEDNLAAQRILAEEAVQQAQVVQAAEVSLRLAQNQYRAGTASYLNVITAQTTLFNARNGMFTLLNRRYQAAVGLIQALGGSWQPPEARQP